MSRTTRARRLGALLVAGLGVAALTGCQTGMDPAEPAVSPTEEVPAEEPADGQPVVNGENSITSPLPGTSVPGPEVVATGTGTAFEATLLYRVLVAGTEDVVVEDVTQAGANGEIGPWTIDLTLEPGEYTLQVWEPDMSDGGGGEPGRNLVETTFTVD